MELGRREHVEDDAVLRGQQSESVRPVSSTGFRVVRRPPTPLFLPLFALVTMSLFTLTYLKSTICRSVTLRSSERGISLRHLAEGGNGDDPTSSGLQYLELLCMVALEQARVELLRGGESSSPTTGSTPAGSLDVSLPPTESSPSASGSQQEPPPEEPTRSGKDGTKCGEVQGSSLKRKLPATSTEATDDADEGPSSKQHAATVEGEQVAPHQFHLIATQVPESPLDPASDAATTSAGNKEAEERTVVLVLASPVGYGVDIQEVVRTALRSPLYLLPRVARAARINQMSERYLYMSPANSTATAVVRKVQKLLQLKILESTHTGQLSRLLDTLVIVSVPKEVCAGEMEEPKVACRNLARSLLTIDALLRVQKLFPAEYPPDRVSRFIARLPVSYGAIRRRLFRRTSVDFLILSCVVIQQLLRDGSAHPALLVLAKRIAMEGQFTADIDWNVYKYFFTSVDQQVIDALDARWRVYLEYS